MSLTVRKTFPLFVSAIFGAAIGGLAVYAIIPHFRYHGRPATLFDQTYFYNNGTVGPFQSFSGIWIDGFEESRFFPNVKSIPTDPMPQTTARLQMDDASRNLIHRFMAQRLEKGCSDVLAISFKGNAVKPNRGLGMPGYIETIYVPTEVLTVKSLGRVC